MKSRMVTTLLAAIAMTFMKPSISANADTNIATNSMGHNTANFNAEHCNSSADASHMWGDVDPNIFYICDAESNTTRQLRCPTGRGFFNGHGYYGCIPYGDWPACRERIGNGSNNDATAQLCREEEYLQHTWAAVDPNKFYICQEQNATLPLLLNCEPGKGYVSAWAGVGKIDGHGGTHIVGCAAWEKWRMYMQCENFY